VIWLIIGKISIGILSKNFSRAFQYQFSYPQEITTHLFAGEKDSFRK